jgi:hypothetical protein
MYNFLRLKSLRIPVLPGAEVSAAQKPYLETEKARRKRETGILMFLHTVNTVDAHIYTE